MTTKQTYPPRSLVISDAKKYVVDDWTGEVQLDASEQKVMLYQPRKNMRGADFVTLYQSDCRRLAQTRMPSNAWRVLLYIVGSIDYENWVNQAQSVIADELGMQPTEVSKHVKQLVERGLIVKSDRSYRACYMRLAQDVAWKGTIANLKRVMEGNSFADLKVKGGVSSVQEEQ
jgi:hypothetical protein